MPFFSTILQPSPHELLDRPDTLAFDGTNESEDGSLAAFVFRSVVVACCPPCSMPPCFVKVQLAWTISRKDRNRWAHVVHGNGGKGSSKSGRKGAMRPTSRDVTFPTDPTNTPDDQDLLEQIKAVLPEAAVVRAQSTLDPSEWDVPIAHPQTVGQ